MNYWNNWVEAMRFSCATQSVIAQRLLLLMWARPDSAAEAILMISEKVDAFGHANIAASKALAEGCGMGVAAERAFMPLQRCVYANNLRLSREVYSA